MLVLYNCHSNLFYQPSLHTLGSHFTTLTSVVNIIHIIQLVLEPCVFPSLPPIPVSLAPYILHPLRNNDIKPCTGKIPSKNQKWLQFGSKVLKTSASTHHNLEEVLSDRRHTIVFMLFIFL